MKIIRPLFLIILLTFVAGIQPLTSLEWPDFTLEAKVSYFRPCESNVRKIYGDGWVDYDVESEQFWCGNNWSIWEGVSWIDQTGDSKGMHNKTNLRLFSARFGMHYFIDITPCLDFYLGSGLCYNYLRIHDHSDVMRSQISDSGVGGIFQTGLRYSLCGCFFADLTIEYLYQKFQFGDHHHGVKRHDLDLSGFKLGGGIGYQF